MSTLVPHGVDTAATAFELERLAALNGFTSADIVVTRDSVGNLAFSVPDVVAAAFDPDLALANATSRGQYDTEAEQIAGLANAAYAATSTGLYVPPGWGANWKTALALAKAGTGKATASIVGDSVSRGMMASDPDATSWTALLRAAIQNASVGNDGGSGFHGVTDDTSNIAALYSNPATYPNTVVTHTGSWFNSQPASLTNWRAGLGGAGYTDGPGANVMFNWAAVGGAASAGTMTFKVKGSIVKVFHAVGAAFSGGSVTVDGAASQSLPTSGVTGIGVFAPTGVSGSGWHTVVISATAGGYTGLWGCAGENTTGAVLNNFSKPGFASGAFATLATTYGSGSNWSGGPFYPSDLHIWSLGLNDALLGVTEATFASNLITHLSAIRQPYTTTGATNNPKQGKVDLLIVMQHGGTADVGVGFNYAAYCQRAEQIAKVFGAAFYNAWPRGSNSWQAAKNGVSPLIPAGSYWGDQAATPAGVAGNDGLHPGTIGHAALYADLVACVPALLAA